MPWRRLRAADASAVDGAHRGPRTCATSPAARLHQLSGGQRQRAFVAQGLAQDADVLLLDEPITGLDLVSRQHILEAMAAERAAGRAVVVSTHDLGDAAAPTTSCSSPVGSWRVAHPATCSPTSTWPTPTVGTSSDSASRTLDPRRSPPPLSLMSTDLHATAPRRLRADGQRYTPRRRALVELLAEVDQPLTIPQLLEQRRDLAQSSAYRNLAVLERAGVVHRIVTTDEFARYELAEDLTEHHHHLICSSCGDVTDFTVPAAVEHDLEAALAKVARRPGFQATDHRLDLVGTCAGCA